MMASRVSWLPWIGLLALTLGACDCNGLPTPTPAVAAIVPSSSTCGADTAVGEPCEVTIARTIDDGPFGGLEFIIDNDAFSFVGITVAALTDGCLAAVGTSVGIVCPTERSGSGPLALLAYDRSGPAPSTFTTSAARLVDFDTGGVRLVGGGTLAVDGAR